MSVPAPGAGPIDLDRVAPGDLITAAFVNRLLEAVQQLNGRVTALEGGTSGPGAPVITGRAPSGDVRVRTELRIFGRNFLVPSNQNTVTLDGRSITQFAEGSNDTTLIVHMPSDFANLPRDFALTVQNRNGTSPPIVLRLVPEAEIPRGRMVVTNVTRSLGQINVGQTYTFLFELNSQTDIPETYELEPRYDNAVGASASVWFAATQLLGAAGRQVRLTPNQPLTLGVNVTVPANAQRVDLALLATSLHNAELTASSTSIPIVIGQTGPVSDPSTTFTLDDYGPAANARKSIIGGAEGVEIVYGSSEDVSVEAHFTVSATYRYEASIENAGTLWGVDPPIPAQSVETAPDAQTVIARVTCRATQPSAEQRYMVFRAIRLKNDGTDDVTSFIRFPIRGFTRP